MDCVAMAERQTTQRTRQRVNEKEAEEISFKDNDAAYGNVQTSEKNGKLEALKEKTTSTTTTTTTTQGQD